MKEKSLNLQPLNMVEMYAVNGGNCPTTWYTNDATINANGKNMDSYFSFIGGFFAGFFGF